MIAESDWQELVQRCGGKCLRCGSTEITRDHIVPQVERGADTIDNVQPLCLRCNQSKGGATVDLRPPPVHAWLGVAPIKSAAPRNVGGRPPKPVELLHSERIELRVVAAQVAAWSAAARAQSMDRSEWMRRALDAAAREVTPVPSRPRR